MSMITSRLDSRKVAVDKGDRDRAGDEAAGAPGGILTGMTAPPSLIEVPTVITTHQNADFDALAAAVGAALLYPEGRIVFAGSLNPNVREFVSLHGESLPILSLRLIDQEKIRQLIIVDTADPERIGDLGRLCGRPDVEIVVFDHHEAENPQRPSFVKGENWVRLHRRLAGDLDAPSPAGARGGDLPARGHHLRPGHPRRHRVAHLSPDHHPRRRDAGRCRMRLGASQALIERYLHSALTREQREVLMRMVDAVRVERVRGIDVHVVALEVPAYVDGLSVIAHKLMELVNAEVLLQAVGMEDRVFVTARSRAGLGGCGHAARDHRRGRACPGGLRRHSRQDAPSRSSQRCSRRSRQTNLGVPTAGEIMSRPVRFIDADTPVTDALVTAQRYGHSGICVQEDGRVVGIVARRDLDKAMRHGLGHAPVKGVMTRNITFARSGTTVDELRRIMVEGNVGRVPVVTDEAYEMRSGRADRPGGGRHRHRHPHRRAGRLPGAMGAGRGAGGRAARSTPCRLSPSTRSSDRLFRACSALSEDFAGVYLVGGFVRDLLLEQPNVDVDVAVEGDGIQFATRLAAQLGGRVRTHRKFKTAVVLLPPAVLGEAPTWLRPSGEPFHVDVATTRTEFYDYPAALPRVEHASIRQDLFRRDFTINAMAVSLRGGDFGTVIDFFGGYRDLREGVIRVLHNLSFIEDPTRIFRAVRYENRYGFRMDEQTKAFAKSCVEMHLVGDLSSVRLREELIPLLSESDVEWTLGRLFELGVAREVHPKLATGVKTIALVKRLDQLVDGAGPGRRGGKLAATVGGGHPQHEP